MKKEILDTLNKFPHHILCEVYIYLYHDNCQHYSKQDLIDHIFGYTRQYLKLHKVSKECCIKYYCLNSWFQYRKEKYN